MAIMDVKLIKKEQVAEDTVAFYFEKPADFEFWAGQFADFTLADPPETDEEGNTRGIPLASDPYEENLLITTRMKDTVFKRALKKLPHNIVLFYSNKTPGDTAFLDDLKTFASENPYFTFVPVMTRTTLQQWSGESGHITKEILTKHVKDLRTPVYYLSGPASMVKTMRQIFTDAQVDEDNIRTEENSGY